MLLCDDLIVLLQIYMYCTLHHCKIDMVTEQLEQTCLLTTVRLHCTMLHIVLGCCVLYIDNILQHANLRQINKNKRQTSDQVCIHI